MCLLVYTGHFSRTATTRNAKTKQQLLQANLSLLKIGRQEVPILSPTDYPLWDVLQGISC